MKGSWRWLSARRAGQILFPSLFVIPTLMLFKGGQLAATKVGAMSKAQLTAFIDQQLA